MTAAGHNQHPADRRCDAPRLIDGLSKPPVLRRATIRWVCVVYVGLVVYGTLGPLGHRDAAWLRMPESWQWVPSWQPTDRNDLLTNVLVYIPVGVALRLLVRRRGSSGAAELLLAVGLSAGLSYGTETLQQLMPARSSSRVDLLVNATAALLGCAIAPWMQNGVRRCHAWVFWHWRRHPWGVLAGLMTGLATVLMTIPWDLSAPALEVQWDRQFDRLDFRRFALFTLLGFTLTMAMHERLGRWPQAVAEAVKRVFVLGVVLEACQILIKSHSCGLLDIGTAFLGGMTGCGAARWLVGLKLSEYRRFSTIGRRAASLALVGLVVLTLASGVSRYSAAGLSPYGLNVIWVPFQTHFYQPFDRVVTDIFESLALYATLTVLCLYLTQGRGRRTALLLLAGLVGLVQLMRMHFPGGAADVTALLLAVLAWLITVRCWMAFFPQGYRQRAVAGSPVQ